MSLDFDGQLNCWYGEWSLPDGGEVRIRMTDPTFQRHLRAMLVSRGLPTLTLSEALDQLPEAQARSIFAARSEVHDELRADLAYWRACGDPEVTVVPLTPK